jgi:threonine dehydratase/serine racemase
MGPGTSHSALRTTYAADLDAIRAAARRIAPYARRTPLLTCAALDRAAGRSVVLKCENLQKVGAFKFRGACNAVQRLDADQVRRGVVTHSSGNHAQALALAASLRGIDAHIVMPSNASAVKRRAVEGYGGKVTLSEPTLEARERTAGEIVRRLGALLIPPYDHDDIIAGQGTVGLEILEEDPAVTAIVAPVGGGGLFSGIALAARGLRPEVRVFAAEPAGADDAARSMAAGRLIPQTAPRTIADGLLTSLGERTWPVVRDLAEAVITVTDDQIIAAMRLIWERSKLIIEPSAAVPVAAVLCEEFRRLPGLPRVAVVLSGGNVDLDHLPWQK